MCKCGDLGEAFVVSCRGGWMVGKEGILCPRGRLLPLCLTVVGCNFSCGSLVSADILGRVGAVWGYVEWCGG